MPSNLGWTITPGDYAEIRRHDRHDETPRMLESCNTCGHPRRMHDLGAGETCEICNGPCIQLGHPNHPQKRGS